MQVSFCNKAHCLKPLELSPVMRLPDLNESHSGKRITTLEGKWTRHQPLIHCSVSAKIGIAGILIISAI